MSMAHARPRTEAETIAATRKSWALDFLGHAAGEYRRHGIALEHFTQRALDYGCTPDEVAEILAARA